mmetsp:Transcript_127590/g.369366  ORF Transcript_127590/g.369366 Transcript_127590/m.369366 type:complete len:509 (+) Transcript_127590:2202-3728(+)
MFAHPTLQALPHLRVLVVVVGEAIQLATLQELRSLVIVLIVNEAAIVRVVVLWLVEGLQDRDVTRIAGVHLRSAGVVQVDIDNGLHLALVEEHHQLAKLGFIAILGVDSIQVLGPIAVVAMRHLLDYRRQDHPVHTQHVQVLKLLANACEISATIVVQLLAPLGRWGREAIDEDLVHRNLRPSPRAPRKVVPRGRHFPPGPLEPRCLAQVPELVRLLEVRLLSILLLRLVKKLLRACDLRGAAVMAAPSASADARCLTVSVRGLKDAHIDLHVEILPRQHRVPLLVHVAVARVAHGHVRRLSLPRARVQHVVAGGIPPDVMQHATANARVPLFVEKLQLHLVARIFAVHCQERLLRHREVVRLLAQSVQDVLQSLRRWRDNHDAGVHEAGVTVPNCADVRRALPENCVWTFSVETEYHVGVQERNLRILCEPPHSEFAHHARPPRVDDGVLVHGLRHRDRLCVEQDNTLAFQQLQVLWRGDVHHVRRDDCDHVLLCAARTHRADHHAD